VHGRSALFSNGGFPGVSEEGRRGGEAEAVENIEKLLAELGRRELISSEAERFLSGFLSRMRLSRDIEEADIASAVKEFSEIEFGSDLGLSDEFLTGEFKLLAASLVAEAAITGAVEGTISSLDVGKIFFVFCQIHDAMVREQ
jgi:hypothetical protein